MMQQTYISAKTQFAQVNGQKIAYRKIGLEGTTPIIYLNHLAANLDGCDPLIMDALASRFMVISFDYIGVGASSGVAATSVEQMAEEVIAFVEVLGYKKVNLLGLSLGGFVAQEMLRQAPQLIGSVILAGTGPSGDVGIACVPRITYWDTFRGLLTRRDPRYYLFFPVEAIARKQAESFLDRVARNQKRDTPTTVLALRRQLRAVVAWANSPKQDFSTLTHRVWIVNGDNDRMVPTSGSYELAKRIPNSTLTIYEGAGHGAIFQLVDRFIEHALAFYGANDR